MAKICRVVNLRQEPYDIYIGRGSKWGNPFPMKNNSQEERDRVCDAYEEYFYKSTLKSYLYELKGKTLGCYCKPLRCHGDFLAKLVNELDEQKPAYAGIGSRETPQFYLDLMTKAAQFLNKRGFILRSGGAIGADSAFEAGAGILKEIYYANPHGNDEQARLIAEKFHPAWDKCSEYARKLHTRNVFQIYGKDISNPVFTKFVIYYTKNGSGQGGTGQAIRIAKANNIPIFDMGLYNETLVADKLAEFLSNQLGVKLKRKEG